MNKIYCKDCAFYDKINKLQPYHRIYIRESSRRVNHITRRECLFEYKKTIVTCDFPTRQINTIKIEINNNYMLNLQNDCEHYKPKLENFWIRKIKKWITF